MITLKLILWLMLVLVERGVTKPSGAAVLREAMDHIIENIPYDDAIDLVLGPQSQPPTVTTGLYSNVREYLQEHNVEIPTPKTGEDYTWHPKYQRYMIDDEEKPQQNYVAASGGFPLHVLPTYPYFPGGNQLGLTKYILIPVTDPVSEQFNHHVGQFFKNQIAQTKQPQCEKFIVNADLLMDLRTLLDRYEERGSNAHVESSQELQYTDNNAELNDYFYPNSDETENVDTNLNSENIADVDDYFYTDSDEDDDVNIEDKDADDGNWNPNNSSDITNKTNLHLNSAYFPIFNQLSENNNTDILNATDYNNNQTHKDDYEGYDYSHYSDEDDEEH